MPSREAAYPARSEPRREPARPPDPAPRGLRTDAPAPRPTAQHLRPADVLRLQRTVGNRAVGRLLSGLPGTGGRVQRAPAAFGRRGGLSVWRYSPGYALGWGEKSPYRSIQESLEAYAAARVDDTARRVELLMAVAKNVQRWREHHRVGTRRADELSEEETNKLNAVNELRDRIGAEWTELGAVDGTLAESEDDEVAVEPAITKQRDSGETKIGFFNANAEVVDGAETVVANVAADSLCRASRKGAPEGKKPVDYWWVEPAEPQLAGQEIFGNQSKNHAAFTPGFVLASSISIGSLVRRRDDLRYSSRTDAALFPLFPGPPAPAHVRQIGLGDCYLQAAMVSLAAAEPDFIRSIMRDNGDTVTVKLFDIVPGPVKTFTERRVTVQKTVPTYAADVRSRGIHKGDEAFSGGALWAQMLEKAYVAAGYQGFSPDTMPVAGGASYGRIESGNSNFAFEHLTGRPATGEPISPVEYEHFNDYKTWLGSDPFQIAVAGPVQDRIQQLAEAEQVPRENDALIQPLMAKVLIWNQVQRTLEPALRELHAAHAQVRLGEVEALLSRLIPVTIVDYRQRALTWIRAAGIYPGKRGTGQYTTAQNELYTRIADALRAGSPVSVGTRSKVARTNGGTGESGGEAMAKGLAGPHGYAVLGVSTSDDLPVNGARPDPPLKFVRLRNPWGHYGRVYDRTIATGRISATHTDEGEFWLLLEDLTKRFDQISIGQIPDEEVEYAQALAVDQGAPRRQRVEDAPDYAPEEWL